MADASLRKKNAGHNRHPSLLAGTRHGRRSHDRPALVPPHHDQNLRGTLPTWHPCLPQYRRTPAPSDGLFTARQSQAGLHRVQPGSQSPVRISGRTAQPLPASPSAHHQRGYQKARTGRQFPQSRPCWECSPRRVFDHDFRTDSIGVAIPLCRLPRHHRNPGALFVVGVSTTRPPLPLMPSPIGGSRKAHVAMPARANFSFSPTPAAVTAIAATPGRPSFNLNWPTLSTWRSPWPTIPPELPNNPSNIALLGVSRNWAGEPLDPYQKILELCPHHQDPNRPHRHRLP